MLKPYKIGEYYIVADASDVQIRTSTKLDGVCRWSFIQNIVWNKGMWQPEETGYPLFKKGAREVAWLEVLVVIGQSKRQAIWEHRACFGVDKIDEDL